jgi:hypothetical protein
MISIRQKPVNADCKRFNPTKAVKKSQYPEWTCASSKLMRTKVPAMARMYASIVKINLL